MLKKSIQKAFLILSIAVVSVASFASSTYASPITARSVVIGNSAASASTSYAFTFTVPSATAIKSIGFDACTTSTGACSPVSGFSSSSSTLASQPTNLGAATGWTVNTGTATALRAVNSGNSTAPTGSQAITFNSVVNPSATNATFFLRITTYSDAAWTTPIDTGTVATSTAGPIQVTATVGEALTFTLASATVALGSLTTSSTGSGTSSMTASTNGVSGYSVTVSGSTLTSSGGNITALTTPTASTQNSKQFGINLMANATPSVGTAASGTGTGTPQTGYNTANSFKFVTGDTVAAATGPTNSNTFTVSYIANIDGLTAAGQYSTNLTYVAAANF
ncbi:MAG: exported protein of unknown function [Candidatus Saccharibacteria bacterium]|nr:exported protein of unknown function [Candidatus Saccharibacteria bacterium]